MNYDSFVETYKPIKNHLDDNASGDGCSFETYGSELEFVLETARENPNKVWTIVDANGKLYLTNGYHLMTSSHE